MFQAIDTSNDRRIDKAEFGSALGLISKWGLKVDNPDAVFDEIDDDKGGMILFDEFADWAIKHKLDLDDDDDAPDAGMGSKIKSAGAATRGVKAPVVAKTKTGTGSAKAGEKNPAPGAAKKVTTPTAKPAAAAASHAAPEKKTSAPAAASKPVQAKPWRN